MGEAVEDSRDGQGPGVFCRVSRSLLTRESDSRALVAFCSGDCTQCPTLREFRDAEAEDRHRSLDREVAATVPAGIR